MSLEEIRTAVSETCDQLPSLLADIPIFGGFASLIAEIYCGFAVAFMSLPDTILCYYFDCPTT